MDIRSLSNASFVSAFSSLVCSERKLTAQIIEYVKEADRRRIYLEFGFTSLFQFLTSHLGYTPGSAQRRIDSARLMGEIPELKEEIQNGSLNLMQVSALSRAVREKQKTSSKTVLVSDKREILKAIKNQDVLSSEKTICQMLDIAPKVQETQRIQKDESIRAEITFSKEQTELLKQLKELVSHTHPNASISDIFEITGKAFVKQKTKENLKAKKEAERANAKELKNLAQSKPTTKGQRTLPSENKTHKSTATLAVKRYIAANIRKEIQREQTCCQWKHQGKECGSKFQLQIDHIKPIWAGGTNEKENLQRLCGVHNRLKYEKESGIKPI